MGDELEGIPPVSTVRAHAVSPFPRRRSTPVTPPRLDRRRRGPLSGSWEATAAVSGTLRATRLTGGTVGPESCPLGAGIFAPDASVVRFALDRLLRTMPTSAATVSSVGWPEIEATSGSPSSIPRRWGSRATTTNSLVSRLGRHPACALGRRVPQQRERCIALDVAKADDRAVGGEAFDVRGDGRAEGVIGDELDERRRTIHGLRRRLGRPRPATCRDLRLRFDRFFGRGLDRLFDLAACPLTVADSDPAARTADRLAWGEDETHARDGVPPSSRPRSKSHGCSPWNSWNESFDSTVPSMRSAIRSRNASPRPIAPAGGETSLPSAASSS